MLVFTRFCRWKIREPLILLNVKINNAIEYNWGDTEGILHHATVPLKAGEKNLGC